MNQGRRAFILKSLGAGIVCGTAPGPIIPNFLRAAEDEQLKTIEAWMHRWMAVENKDVIGALHVSRFADPMYFLLKPITWKPNPDQSAYPQITVPIGFVTDFASIPRVFWSLLRPDGLYTYPAIVHDYLYWTQTTSKDVADNILRLGMGDFGISRATITTVYEAVKSGGGGAWKSNAQLKAAGEKRVLKEFPNDPRTRWGDWKKDPQHFSQV
jgi:hypothetical protein